MLPWIGSLFSFLWYQVRLVYRSVHWFCVSTIVDHNNSPCMASEQAVWIWLFKQAAGVNIVSKDCHSNLIHWKKGINNYYCSFIKLSTGSSFQQLLSQKPANYFHLISRFCSLWSQNKFYSAVNDKMEGLAVFKYFIVYPWKIHSLIIEVS